MTNFGHLGDENENTEFKALWKDDYLKTLCAFANTSGGTLRPEISMDNLLKPHPSLPHNPIIASVFYKAGLIENWGRGTIDIMDECNKQGLPQPLFEYEFTTLKVTFYKAKVPDARDGGVNGGVNEVYQFIMQNSNTKAKQISQSLGIPLRTLQRYLNRCLS